MLRSVNWGEKVGRLFGGHLGRILRVCILFACAVILLIGLYRVRTARITKEEDSKNQLKSVAQHAPIPARVDKWLVVANPENISPIVSSSRSSEEEIRGSHYACSTASIATSLGWKILIIGPHLSCCIKPNCYAIDKSQFLRMPYRSSSVLRHLLGHGGPTEPYKETVRNIAFIWALHRGARYIYDAYLDEYQSASVPIGVFEEELSRQLQTLALDESLALVEERGRSRVLNLKSNPYSHFGRPDVKLLPSGPGSSSGSKNQPYSSFSHYSVLSSPSSNPSPVSARPNLDFPSYRICEVRPPSIEKFLEIDEGWWDTRAPALVLPGDTMPPLCTRNTLFSPEVFWALPLLPDYSAATEDERKASNGTDGNNSRIPPWYIRGLWSQSLLGDIGGSIRLSLSRVPTLQLNQDYFAGGDYEPLSQSVASTNKSSSRLLKRWNCRSRSTFRCLLLMSRELSKSVFLGKDDLSLVEAWIIDLKALHYSEPRMLPKRRSHTNPCLGADGLHGVSFYPALEPKLWQTTEDFIAKRNETLKEIVAKNIEEGGEEGRKKRESGGGGGGGGEITLATSLVPPQENSTYAPIDWSRHVSDYKTTGDDSYLVPSASASTDDSYFPIHEESSYEDFKGSRSEDTIIADRSIPITNLDTFSRLPKMSRTGKQFRSFVQEIVAKSVEDGTGPEEFPILKGMAENMCPGYGKLLPYAPTQIQSDILLIIVFTNHHYDLIPTLEVLYRSSYPNILYCGHPHESVEIFLRKYQTVESRSFSFLPTYTRSSYECLLGAIEMNYEVKGYLVITDETLLGSRGTLNLDKEKLWVSSSSFDKVTRKDWARIDPGGQKLPRLLDGITSAWKLFSYILQGQDSVPFLENGKRVKKRSAGSGEEVLEAEETAYVHGNNYKWDHQAQRTTENLTAHEHEHLKSPHGDLEVSDWDYAKPIGENKTESEEGGEEEVLIGEEEDENSPPNTNMSDIIQLSSSSPLSTSTGTDEGGIDLGKKEENEEEEDVENSESSSSVLLENSTQENISSSPLPETSTEDGTESSLGVPLYHVEHAEPPSQPKWHQLSTTEKEIDNFNVSTTPLPSSTISYNQGESGGESVSSTETDIGSGEVGHDEELKRDMDTLLEVAHETYVHLIAIVNEYLENNKEYVPSHPPEFSGEVSDHHLLEDSKSHRISPREFRHIRCTKLDDGHQSDLCGILRNYVVTLGSNLGRDIRLFHDSIPIYYLPTGSIKTFYSVANVLLHYGVMDELALPLVFRGIAQENEWIHLNRTTTLSSIEASNTQYVSPFNFHKVYSDSTVKKDFCSNYLFKVLQI